VRRLKILRRCRSSEVCTDDLQDYRASIKILRRNLEQFKSCCIVKQTHSQADTAENIVVADRLQAGRSSLHVFTSQPGTVIPRWWTSSDSRVGVSKSSVFCFVLSTVCSPYPILKLRWPSFSSRRCTDLEQSSAAYHICSVTSHLLLSLEDILLRTLLPVITVVVPV